METGLGLPLQESEFELPTAIVSGIVGSAQLACNITCCHQQMNKTIQVQILVKEDELL